MSHAVARLRALGAFAVVSVLLAHGGHRLLEGPQAWPPELICGAPADDAARAGPRGPR